VSGATYVPLPLAGGARGGAEAAQHLSDVDPSPDPSRKREGSADCDVGQGRI